MCNKLDVKNLLNIKYSTIWSLHIFLSESIQPNFTVIYTCTWYYKLWSNNLKLEQLQWLQYFNMTATSKRLKRDKWYKHITCKFHLFYLTYRVRIREFLPKIENNNIARNKNLCMLVLMLYTDFRISSDNTHASINTDKNSTRHTEDHDHII